jgi:HK97 family phage major capsid protein
MHDFSKQLLIQSSLAAENLIRSDLGNASAAMIDSQAINGSGAGTEMRGIRNTPGVNAVAIGANGGVPTWASVVDLESQALIANAGLRRPAYLLNAKTRKALKTTQKAANLAMIIEDNDTLNGTSYLLANNLPSTLTKGTAAGTCSASLYGSDWSMAVIAYFGGLDITVDPYTLANIGSVRITLNTFADFGVRQPACFSKIEDWITP